LRFFNRLLQLGDGHSSIRAFKGAQQSPLPNELWIALFSPPPTFAIKWEVEIDPPRRLAPKGPRRVRGTLKGRRAKVDEVVLDRVYAIPIPTEGPLNNPCAGDRNRGLRDSVDGLWRHDAQA